MLYSQLVPGLLTADKTFQLELKQNEEEGLFTKL